ncbi:MAG: sulfurtransferase [Betaproteobacteria bacterium]|jgi:thiosulfate/3-mercaptopyruvate sulfurtransferase|nr:MAG: sulfurtransferase [Betaproteobacteria bacterium]
MFENPLIARFAAVAALSIAGIVSSPTAGAEERIIVDTAFVEDAISDGGALVWDVRSEKDYLRGHIPGAVNVGSVTRVLRDSRTKDYIPIDEIARILGEAGIDGSREIVVYGSKARPSAYFGYITLRYLGVGDVTVYHGGIDDWKSAGKPVETTPSKLPPATFTATPDPSQLVTTSEVIEKLGDSSVQIVDARTVNEYSGKDIRALRGGHIPGAVNIPYQTNWVDPDTPRKLARKKIDNKDGMNLKPRDELQAMYAQLDKDKETIVYCQSGGRAAESAVILQQLGFNNVRIYDSSWLAYGNTFEAPVENVTYFDVGRVNSMIRSLQMQIDSLEGEIATLKAKQKQQ